MPLPDCGAAPDANRAYFVSEGVGEDVANCGGPEGPCRSLRKGLARAVDNGIHFIFLDNTADHTATETLALPPNVVVAGGFSNVNGHWTRLCDARGKTRLLSSANPVISAEFSGAAKLDSLTVETRSAGPSETMLGVLVRGTETQLWLSNVTIAAADGGAGSPGEQGAPGGPGAAVNATCAPGDGAAGMFVGSRGADASAGTFGPNGYEPAHGATGGDGEAGHAGTEAPAPSCCETQPGTCSQRGAPGCGGPGGHGGAGGRGGGSSVALYLWDAQVFVEGGALRAGNGGNAGPRGAAGSGGTGAAGRMGDNAACPFCIDLPPYSGTQCYVATIPGTQAGTGGNGQAGGEGGAGANGFSYAVFQGGAAKLEISPDTVLTFGAAGKSADGAPGSAGPIGHQ
jgi:hypothetical protein